jgi:predicted metal-dependent HD superfamily phosphohydrolase
MQNLLNALYYNWHQLLQSFEVERTATQETFDALVKAYSSSDRHYHTLRHIWQVLDAVQQLQEEATSLTTVQLAGWMHDVVYNPCASDNEEQSAIWAATLLRSLHLPAESVAQVVRLILLTKDHTTSTQDRDGQVLLDADLSILAADAVDYRQYADAIRCEYAWVSDTDYIAGRKRVLQEFLNRDRIYHTPRMAAIAEQPARQNLITELKRLPHHPAASPFLPSALCPLPSTLGNFQQ